MIWQLLSGILPRAQMPCTYLNNIHSESVYKVVPINVFWKGTLFSFANGYVIHLSNRLTLTATNINIGVWVLSPISVTYGYHRALCSFSQCKDKRQQRQVKTSKYRQRRTLGTTERTLASQITKSDGDAETKIRCREREKTRGVQSQG